MVHKLLNSNALCIRDGKCAKEYPKLCRHTRISQRPYHCYRRSDNGQAVMGRGHTLDNRYVVHYNPYLLAKFNCHNIDIELTTTVKSVKQIYKCVYKGYVAATIGFEIQNFISGPYVGLAEAVQHIYEMPMLFQFHRIYRLQIHLPDHQTVLFRRGEELNSVQNVGQSKLLAFCENNIKFERALKYTYVQIPQKLRNTQVKATKKWKLEGGKVRK